MTDDQNTAAVKAKLGTLHVLLSNFIENGTEEANLTQVKSIIKMLEKHDNRLKDINNTSFSKAEAKKGWEHYGPVLTEYFTKNQVDLTNFLTFSCFEDELENLPKWVRTPSAVINKNAKEREVYIKARKEDGEEAPADDNMDSSDADDDEPEKEKQVNKKIGEEHNESRRSSMENFLTDTYNNLMAPMNTALGMLNRNASTPNHNGLHFTEADSVTSLGRKSKRKDRPEAGEDDDNDGDDAAPRLRKSKNNGGKGSGGPAAKVVVRAPEQTRADGTTDMARIEQLFSNLEAKFGSNVKANSDAIEAVGRKAEKSKKTLSKLYGETLPAFKEAVNRNSECIKVLAKEDTDISEVQRDMFYSAYSADCDEYKAKVDELVNKGLVRIDILDTTMLEYDNNGRAISVRIGKLTEAIGFEMRVISRASRKEGKALSVLCEPKQYVIDPKNKVKDLLIRRRNFARRLGINYSQPAGYDFSATWWTLKRSKMVKDFIVNFKGFAIVVLPDDTRVKIKSPKAFANLEQYCYNPDHFKLLADEANFFPWNGKIYRTPDYHKNRILKTREFFNQVDRQRADEGNMNQSTY